MDFSSVFPLLIQPKTALPEAFASKRACGSSDMRSVYFLPSIKRMRSCFILFYLL